ncbi:ligand-binding protein SH3 [Paraburkholderia sp.]|jgi:small multidrug resistance pump|uniref:ligand-binding protein SH3 n=1 Tax=Paraburkholderia sp. TaxID=1926495 RepID=UPI002F3E56E2
MYMILLLLSGTCSATASVLLRIAGQSTSELGSATLALFDRAMLLRVGALGAYGMGFIFYALALKKIPLSVAYPFMVCVTLLEIFIVGVCINEAPTLKTLLGAGFLLAGVFLLYSSGPARA